MDRQILKDLLRNGEITAEGYEKLTHPVRLQAVFSQLLYLIGGLLLLLGLGVIIAWMGPSPTSVLTLGPSGNRRRCISFRGPLWRQTVAKGLLVLAGWDWRDSAKLRRLVMVPIDWNAWPRVHGDCDLVSHHRVGQIPHYRLRLTRRQPLRGSIWLLKTIF